MNKLYLSVYDPVKKRDVHVGVVEDGVLTKVVNPKKHFMRTVGGYGIQDGAIEELEGAGVTTIVIKETGGKKYSASIEIWKNESKKADYGYGKQVFLSVTKMQII